MTGYLDELAERLRDRGVDPARVDSTVADLHSYLAETGADPEAEFGSADAFAAAFTGSPDGPAVRPEPESEHWSWTTDTFSDIELLDRHGGEGWEVMGVDRLGRFVCRRDLADPQRWEYRREWVLGGRQGVAARLAPEGWEPCGAWVIYEWFKRPLAASVGPAAAVADPPPTPAKSNLISRPAWVLIGLTLAVIPVGTIYTYVVSGDVAETLGFLTGGITGALAVVLAVLAFAAWQNRSR